MTIKQNILQEYEGNQILQELSNAGINCIALKGWELRKLYPSPLMRQMADLDILVKSYDYKRIQQVMEKLGFSGDTESSLKHDSFKKSELNIEIHKRLTDDSASIQAWEEEMWVRTVGDRHILRMTPEDFYIYHFVHLHNDFMHGSLGLRRILDTWLLQSKPVDISFVKNELEKFGIWKFHEQMVNLCHAMMGEAEFGEDTEFLLEHAFVYGIYGTESSYKAAKIASVGSDFRGGKIQSLIATIFLPYKMMKARYPVLRKWPLLLPLCWIKRIVWYLRRDLKKNKKKLNYRYIGSEEFDEMKQFFKAGGVEN